MTLVLDIPLTEGLKDPRIRDPTLIKDHADDHLNKS